MFNGVAISGATNSSLLLTNVVPSEAGGYSVVASDPAESVTSATATLTVVTNMAPTIITQPQSQNAPQGSTVTFTVAATGANDSYQWFFNGEAIPLVAGTSLVLIDQASTVGAYWVIVSNPYGSATSNIVTLKD